MLGFSDEVSQQESEKLSEASAPSPEANSSFVVANKEVALCTGALQANGMPFLAATSKNLMCGTAAFVTDLQQFSEASSFCFLPSAQNFEIGGWVLVWGTQKSIT